MTRSQLMQFWSYRLDFKETFAAVYPRCLNIQISLKLNHSCPASIYLFKVDNGNIRTMCEICLKLTVKTPERRQWCHSGVFIVDFNRFHTFFWCFHCWLWTSKCRQGATIKTLSPLYRLLDCHCWWLPRLQIAPTS